MIRLRHLKMASRYARHRFRDLHPFEVQASILNACNLACAYCSCPDVKTALLTTDEWRAIIRGLAEVGTMRIKFQGGEPTMRPDFRDLCAEVRAAGIITAVISNGVLIPSRPNLLDHLDELVVSLDSPRSDTNDRLRGDGTGRLAIQAIDLARGRGMAVFVNMVVTQDNLADLEAMLNFCEDRGIRMHAQPVMFGRRYYDSSARPLGLTSEQIRAMHHRLAEWKRQGRGLMFSEASYRRAAEWPDHDFLAIRSDGRSACMAGTDYVHIEPNGDVHPCAPHSANFSPRNILRDGLEASLRQARVHDCGDCWVVYLNERKQVFGLQPRALWEMARRG